MKNGVKWSIVAIILISAFLRLYNLGLPPLFFDECIHAVILKNSFLQGKYTYNPAYHGPLLYLLLSIPTRIMGFNEFSLRILPAITGIIITVFPIILYRKYMGTQASLISSLFIAVSPLIVNYSRFARADIFQLLFVWLAVYFIFEYLQTKNDSQKRVVYLLIVSVCLALFACLKETFYPFAVIMLFFFIFDLKKVRIRDIPIPLIAFVTIYFTIYTNGFTYLEPLTNFSKLPVVQAIKYWIHQHEIARIGGPIYYYLLLILFYDLPVFLIAIYGLIHVLKGRENTFMVFVAYMFLSTLIFFSYLQEKVPWLTVHILYPMYLLAGFGISKIGLRKVKYLVLVLCAFYLIWGSIAMNIVNPTNPAEPGLYLPHTLKMRSFAENVVKKGKRAYMIMNIGEYWPLGWYLNNSARWSYVNFSDRGSYVILNSSINNTYYKEHANQLKYIKTIPIRCWTFWTNPNPSRFLDFFIFRKPIAPIACMNFSIYKIT